MTSSSKDDRRESWKGLNFAGTIDWAVDLQSFTKEDAKQFDRTESGDGCVEGDDDTIDSGDLCKHACHYGFCPTSLCTCLENGTLAMLPEEIAGVDVEAYDPSNLDLNRLCQFSCKYGYCPEDICIRAKDESLLIVPPEYDDSMVDQWSMREDSRYDCIIWKEYSPEASKATGDMCYNACAKEREDAETAGENFNAGCTASGKIEDLPWAEVPGRSELGPATKGTCFCNTPIIDSLANAFLEAMPALGQVC
jgi:hypothetical protein